MSYERKDGDCVLFTNERKNDTQPVLRGELLLEGKTYNLAFWGKTSKKGTKFWTGRAQPKPEPQEQPKEPNNLDDEIPF